MLDERLQSGLMNRRQSANLGTEERKVAGNMFILNSDMRNHTPRAKDKVILTNSFSMLYPILERELEHRLRQIA